MMLCSEVVIKRTHFKIQNGRISGVWGFLDVFFPVFVSALAIKDPEENRVTVEAAPAVKSSNGNFLFRYDKRVVTFLEAENSI